MRIVGMWYFNETRYDYISPDDRPKYRFAKVVKRVRKSYEREERGVTLTGWDVEVDLYSRKRVGTSEIPGTQFTEYYLPDKKIGHAKGLVQKTIKYGARGPRIAFILRVYESAGHRGSNLVFWDKEKPAGITDYQRGH